MSASFFCLKIKMGETHTRAVNSCVSVKIAVTLFIALLRDFMLL